LRECCPCINVGAVKRRRGRPTAARLTLSNVLVMGIALERLKRMDEFHKKFDLMTD
jgi:hypothetical protein